MAIVSLEKTIITLPAGGEAWAEVLYNTANNRITTVDWSIPMSGVAVRVNIYDHDVLVYDRTYGQGTGSENVPGSHRVVFDAQNRPFMPDYLKAVYFVQLVGP